jgi:hypothetical protein
VDTDLGYLTGYTSWRSKLYLAQLHIQTSVNWMPDPLTSRTGIQEALWLLRSAGCRSIRELDTRHEAPELLSSPDYKIYPQISFAIGEINYLIARERFLRAHQNNLNESPPTRPLLDVKGALHAAHLFPFEDAVPKLPVLSDVVHRESLEAEDLACTVSLAVYHLLIITENGPELPVDTERMETLVKKLTWDLFPPSIAEVDAVLQEIKGACQRFRLLFLLPMILYRQKHFQLAFLSVLMVLARRFLLENPPCCAECRMLDGSHLPPDALRKCFADARYSPIFPGEEDLDTVAVDRLIAAWPSGTGLVIPLHDYPYDVKKLNTELQRLFSSCYRNLELKEEPTNRLSGLGTEIHTFLEPSPVQSLQQASNLPSEAQGCTPGQGMLGRLLVGRSAPKLPAPSRLRCCGPPGNRPSSDSDTHSLNPLFASIRTNMADPSFKKRYLPRLHDSARHARVTRGVTLAWAPSTEELQKHYVQCRDNYMAGLTIVQKELYLMDDLGHAQWPQITPNTLFRYLASASPIKLPDGWKQCLVSLALLLVELQRSRRLLRYSLDNQEEELSRELENEGCDGWSADEYPDWLLIQVRCLLSSVYFC